jgi:hypothetical protein
LKDEGYIVASIDIDGKAIQKVAEFIETCAKELETQRGTLFRQSAETAFHLN